MNDEIKLAETLESYLQAGPNNSPAGELSVEEERELAGLLELAAGFKALSQTMPKNASDSVLQNLLKEAQSSNTVTANVQSPTRRKPGRLLVPVLSAAAVFALLLIALSVVLLGLKTSSNVANPPASTVVPTPLAGPVSANLINIIPSNTGVIRVLAWSPDGKWLASGSDYGAVSVWDSDFRIRVGSTSEPKPGDDRKPLATLSGIENGVYRLIWSPDSQTFSPGNNRLYNPQGDLKATLPDGFYGWSPDGKLQIYHLGKVLELRQPDGKLAITVSIPEGNLGLVAMSPDGKVIATGGQNVTSAGPSNIRLWLWTPDGKNIATLSDFGRPFTSLDWSPDSRILAASTKGEPARLYSPDGKLIKVLDSEEKLVWSLAWSPDGQLLVGGCDDGKIRFWNKVGTLVGTVEVKADQAIWSLAWSVDGKWLATGSNDKIMRIWEITR